MRLEERPDTFCEWFRAASNYGRAVAYKVLRDRDEAEDVAMEILRYFASKSGSFCAPEPGGEHHWCRLTGEREPKYVPTKDSLAWKARNEACNRLVRELRRRPAQLPEQFESAGLPPLLSVLDPEVMRACVEKLPEKARTYYLLHEYRYLALSVIAELEAVTVDAVKQARSRAIPALAACFIQNGGGNEGALS